MSEAAVKAVLSQPDTATPKGIRDLFLMVLLYDTGARIQEILNIRLRDLQLHSAPMITLLGKGQKVRNVSMMGTTVEHFKRYAGLFHTEEKSYSKQFLFYVNRNNEKKRMTEDNVRRFIRAYGSAAQKACPEVPDNVHPHLFWHSRAMHLYQHGMPLALISQWLGHSGCRNQAYLCTCGHRDETKSD
jgi:integrase/recombinase XerD